MNVFRYIIAQFVSELEDRFSDDCNPYRKWEGIFAIITKVCYN